MDGRLPPGRDLGLGAPPGRSPLGVSPVFSLGLGGATGGAWSGAQAATELPPPAVDGLNPVGAAGAFGGNLYLPPLGPSPLQQEGILGKLQAGAAAAAERKLPPECGVG